MSEKIPGILILKSMQPKEVDEERLISPAIDEHAELYSRHEAEAWEQFLDTEAGSIEEESLGRTLAKIYLVKTSQKLSSPESYRRGRDRDLWADRFTASSGELYEAPQLPFIRQVVETQLSELRDAKGPHADKVLTRYHAFSRSLETEVTSETDTLSRLSKEQLEALANSFIEANLDWFSYLDENRREVYTAVELQQLFSDLISIRAQSDQRWGGWSAELEAGKDTVSVNGSKEVISVGADRADLNHTEVVNLVAHELGIHAQRYVNGRDIDGSLASGLAGYIDTEESLGILAERLVSGRTPDKANDRYVDIALGMGIIPGIRFTRKELIGFATDRALARKELAGEMITQETITEEVKKAKTHVHRIFRGGDGLGGENPAVFTKDAIYYPAVLEDYLAKELDGGKGPEEILDFLLLGKFDPTNERHIEKVKQLRKTTG